MSRPENSPVNPWIVVDQPEDGGNLHIYLCGNEKEGYAPFALIVADIIQTVAAAFDMPPEDVLERVSLEVGHPTTTFQGGRIN